jgi:hypothetical protein
MSASRFEQSHKLTSPAKSAPALSLCGATSPLPPAGAYDQGLLTILDQHTGQSALQYWTWLTGEGAIATVLTGFGDLFYSRPAGGIFFLEPQRGLTQQVTTTADEFLEDFLSWPRLEEILSRPRFERVVKLNRPLKYGEIFILVPWQMLGGDEKDQNYEPGGAESYLHLVGQSLARQNRARE